MPFVFGYGSLVDRASIQATLGRELGADDGPRPVRLQGHRRAWNVAAHSSQRPDYGFVHRDGTAWQGWVGFLGLEASQADATPGAVVRLAPHELSLLDARERGYHRTDVSDLVDVGGHGEELPSGEPVFTYLPRADAVAAAEQAGGQGVVMGRYVRVVERGYRELGEAVHAEHRATFPDPSPFRVQDLWVRPSHGARHEAVDPADD